MEHRLIDEPEFAQIADSMPWGALQREAVRLEWVCGLDECEIAEAIGAPPREWLPLLHAGSEAMRRYLFPHSRTALAQQVLAAMRGPRRHDPSAPALRLDPRTMEWREVALRSPVVAPEDLCGDYWRTWMPRSGAEVLARMMEV